MRSLDGITTTLSDTAVESLRAKLSGGLLAPGDAGYDDARAVWNGMIDRRPGLIAQCIGTADVVETVRFAAEQDLLNSVKAGGHNIAGQAICEDRFVIDLSRMRGVFVDTAGRTARGRRAARSARPNCTGWPRSWGSFPGAAGVTVGGGF